MKLALALLSLSTVAAQDVDSGALSRAVTCNQEFGPLKFLLLEKMTFVEIWPRLDSVTLSKSDINDARQSGNFHFSLTETWGSPYDPHTYASGWIDGLGGEGVFPAMVNFSPGSSRSELLGLVKNVLEQEEKSVLEQKWNEIHNYYHSQAVMLPLWGKRVPTLLNSRLTGYQAGYQQFDYPIHKLSPLTGSSTVTVAPGARTGLFETVGFMDAHTYGPNEFFSSNWVYEGLVSYGQGGQILPSLASSWTVTTDNGLGGDTYTFTLRENVQFHDGSPWDCAAAKLNFDHLLSGELRSRHGWYGIPLYTVDWFCNNDMEFVLRTNSKHGPYLQELTFIRPIRMISPAAFVKVGNATDATAANSCRIDWGVIDGNDVAEDVVCAGIEGIYGTGPFVFQSRDTVTVTGANGEEKEVDNEVIFTAFEDYWGGASAVKRLEVKRYETSADVKAALLSEDLDVVWGSGVLSDADIFEIENGEEYQNLLRVFHSGDLQNVILLLNSGQAPFDDINVRKTVIHAINKAAFVEKELKGLQQVVDNVFPLDAPFCKVDLTPRWDYDFEKAVLLSCGGLQGGSSMLAWGLGLGLGSALALMVTLACVFYNRSKQFEEALELTKKAGAVEA